MEAVVEVVLAWFPFLAVLGVGTVLIGLASWLLLHRWDAAFSRGRLYRRLFLVALTGAVIVSSILVLPVAGSMRGQLLGFLGVLISAMIALSSTTFLGNVMAGLMLRTVRNMRPGDFIRVGDHFGRISEFELLYTEIQTETRSLTTIPNLHLVTNPVTVIRSSGTVVTATVSLGYDTSRHRATDLLEEAARRAELSDAFVQVVELADHAVTYRVHGVLEEVKLLMSARARLRAKIMDVFHEAKIDLVSPDVSIQGTFDPDEPVLPPPPSRPVPEGAEPSPEAIVFDKAERAETIALLKSTLQDLGDELSALEETPEEERDDAAIARVELRIGILERRLERLTTDDDDDEAEGESNG